MKVLIKTKEQLGNTQGVFKVPGGWKNVNNGSFFNDEMVNLCGKMIEVQENYKYNSNYQYRLKDSPNNWLIANWMIAPEMNRNGANG